MDISVAKRQAKMMGRMNSGERDMALVPFRLMSSRKSSSERKSAATTVMVRLSSMTERRLLAAVAGFMMICTLPTGLPSAG